MVDLDVASFGVEVVSEAEHPESPLLVLVVYLSLGPVAYLVGVGCLEAEGLCMNPDFSSSFNVAVVAGPCLEGVRAEGCAVEAESGLRVPCDGGHCGPGGYYALFTEFLEPPLSCVDEVLVGLEGGVLWTSDVLGAYSFAYDGGIADFEVVSLASKQLGHGISSALNHHTLQKAMSF